VNIKVGQSALSKAGIPLNNEIHILLDQIKNWLSGKSTVIQ